MNKNENISYFNKWSSFYNKDPISLWLLYLQRKVLAEINFTKELSVLDVGCGTASSLELLHKKGLTKLYGIDLSPKMIERAQEKLGKKAVLKVASVEEIPFSSNKFDIVITTEGFHHFPDPEKAVKEMSRVLKKNGLLFISDLNFYIPFLHWLFKKLEPGHVKIYNEKEFKELFKINKVKIIRQKRIGLFTILTMGQK